MLLLIFVIPHLVHENIIQVKLNDNLKTYLNIQYGIANSILLFLRSLLNMEKCSRASITNSYAE